MALVTGVTLPNDGDRIKAINYNDPIQKILAQLNGNIDTTNVASISGSKITNTSLPVAALADDVAAGWFPSSDVLTYAGNAGNKEYTITTPGDKTTKYSAGMRIRITRAVVPSTQSADFESGSTQYANKTTPSGIVFTDDFTCEAWIKLESYTASNQVIVSRRSGLNGWQMYVNSAGQLGIFGGSNPNYRIKVTTTSVPLNKWVHVAATLDMSGNIATFYMNGVSIPYTSADVSTPTSLVQAGDLMLGNYTGGTEYFDGLMAEVRVWNTILSQVTVQQNMNISLTGAESNLMALFKLAGNFNDSTSNTNNLTATGAVATFVDHPMKPIEYGIITKVAYSAPNTTLTVFTGTDYNIPNGSLSNLYYSAQRAPFGFPTSRNKWMVQSYLRATNTTAIGAFGTWFPSTYKLVVPTGSWEIINQGSYNQANSSNGLTQVSFRINSVSHGVLDTSTTYFFNGVVSSGGFIFPINTRSELQTDSQETLTVEAWAGSGGGTVTAVVRGDVADASLTAVSAYL